MTIPTTVHVLDDIRPALDPITVITFDHKPGSGQLLIECYGMAWSCWWGSMGGGVNVLQFVATSDEGYVANCLLRGKRVYISNKRVEQREMAYLVRICKAVIDFARRQKGGAA